MTNSLDALDNSNSGSSVPRDPKEKAAFELFDKVFQQFTAAETILSFNGGKDCTLLLDLLSKYYQQSATLRGTTIRALYIQGDDSFEEMDQFVQRCREIYHIELIQRNGGIKSTLEKIYQEIPELKAVFMGSRRTDPFCKNFTTFMKTDPGWPDLMRIHPILDWSCKDVWRYLLVNEVKYCKLYDQGYTSLGSKKNTKPNPHLKVIDPATGAITYKPAYELITDDSLERAGRF